MCYTELQLCAQLRSMLLVQAYTLEICNARASCTIASCDAGGHTACQPAVGAHTPEHTQE
jgi:hypothetical protein